MAGEVAALRSWETGAAFYPAVEGDSDSYSSQSSVVRNGSNAGLIVLNGNEYTNYNPGPPPWRRCLLRETLNNSNQDVMRAERYGDHYFYTWSYRINTGTYVPSGHLIWEIHGPNEDWPANTSLVAPHALQWRNNEWQYRVHTGKRTTGTGTQTFGGQIYNYSLGLTSKNEGLWRDWIIEILYDDPGIINVWTRLEGTSAFTQVMARTNPGVCYVTDKTEDHRYYRTEGAYQEVPVPSSTECRVWVDNGGRHLTYNDALAVFGEAPTGGTPVYFSDTWDNGSIGSDWTSYNTTWTVTETGGVLSIGGTGATGSAGVTSRLTNYTLANSEISCRIPNPGNTASVSQLRNYLAFRDDASNALIFAIENNTTKAIKQVAGVETTLASAAYNAVGHQFLRIRVVSTTINFDTSADGITWYNFYNTSPVPITVTSGYIDLGASATAPSGAVGTITFDNFIYQAQSGGVLSPDPNPSSFPVLNGASDGYAHATATTYATASGVSPTALVWKDTDTTMYAGRTYDGTSEYTVDTVVLQFDTSGIPDDATLQAAFLDLNPPSCGSADARSLVGEYYAGALSTAAHTANISGTACFASKAISTITAGQMLSLPMTNISNISKTGVTKLRLQVSGGSPTGANWVGISGFESNRATLRVTYTIGGAAGGGTYTYVYASAGVNGTNSGTKKTGGALRTAANGTRDYTRI